MGTSTGIAGYGLVTSSERQVQSAAPCGAGPRLKSTTLMPHAAGRLGDANHNQRLLIVQHARFHEWPARCKERSDAADRGSHSADGGRSADACGMRLRRHPLAGAGVHARQGARPASAGGAARHQDDAGEKLDAVFTPASRPTQVRVSEPRHNLRGPGGPRASRPRWFRSSASRWARKPMNRDFRRRDFGSPAGRGRRYLLHRDATSRSDHTNSGFAAG